MTLRRILPLALLLALVAVLAAGCGGDDETASPTDSTQVESTGGGTADAIKVGLVTDIGGLDDRSFNFLANQGLERAKSQLGVEGRVVISKSNADYVPNLASLAQDDYDLVI